MRATSGRLSSEVVELLAVTAQVLGSDGRVGLIYQAAVEPDCWPIFLGALREELRATSIHLSFRLPRQGDRGSLLSVGMDQRFEDAYRAHFHRLDPWMPSIAGEDEGEVRGLESFVPESELVRTEFYNDWMRPQGILHGFGAFLCKSGPTELVSSLSGFRGEGEGRFEGEDLDRIRPLVPHLQQALVIHRRLRAAELRADAAEEAMDHISTGVILIDDRGAPLATSQAADQLLASEDGLCLDRDGPRAALPEQTRELQRLLDGAVKTGAGRAQDPGGALRLARPSGRPPLEVVVTPIRMESLPFFDRRAAAAIFVAEPDLQTERPPARLRRIYGLTPAEAEVASRIAGGMRLTEIGEDLEVSIHTVRGHLKQLFAKTGTRRQVDLVRELVAGPARLCPLE